MIIPIRDIDIRFVPGTWPVPEALRAQVPAMWAKLRAENPHLWNGRVLGVSAPGGGGPPVVVDGVLRGEAREDAFAAFLTWRELGFPEIGVRNVFGSSVIIAADGAVLLGVMAKQTANAGSVYPPGGSLEPRDVGRDGRVDVVASLERELHEETGLRAAEAQAGMTAAVFDGPRVSAARLFHFTEMAEALARRVRDNLERQTERELADVVIVRPETNLTAIGVRLGYVRDLVAAVFDRTLR